MGCGSAGWWSAGLEARVTLEHLREREREFMPVASINVGPKREGQLVDTSDGSLDAGYEYDAYGGLLVCRGRCASDNLIRFSTKYNRLID